jgi:predicted RNA-binding Zn-ribbon protein involved in translation (DUF1610 family)
MGSKRVEIICPACGDESILRREPLYDGFKKVGETLSCLACGHVFENEEEVPFKGASGPNVFTEADRVKTIDVFAGDEKGRLCRYCEHYTVNPFTQRCSLHNRLVEATDTCPDFSPKDKPAD